MRDAFGTQRHRQERAFTLIEVLVALAIVSIGLLAALRAAGQGADSAADLRARLLAGWVAQNRLAEHRARGDWLDLGIQRGTAREGGFDFEWREEIIATPNPQFRRLDVFVYATTGGTAARSAEGLAARSGEGAGNGASDRAAARSGDGAAARLSGFLVQASRGVP
ncbi:MAG TPA: type II secretion system minor pseudopilin GspI [Burkholderiales bacterium]|nr:type II secretion system minor pseudopilin GspI [Burkholderiales bacterium]